MKKYIHFTTVLAMIAILWNPFTLNMKAEGKQNDTGYQNLEQQEFSAAKDYSGSTVTYLNPYKFDSFMYGQHEVSLTKMTTAINASGGYYIW